MISDCTKIKTDETLLKNLRSAAGHRVSAHERMEQRVSFAYGSMGFHSNATKDLVRRVVLEQHGSEVEVGK